MAVDGIELDAVRRERGQGKNNFPVQPIMNIFGNLTRLIPTLLNDFYFYFLRTSSVGGGGGLLDFLSFPFFPVQQTASGIGHRVRPTLMGTKNLYENGPNPFFAFVFFNLMGTRMVQIRIAKSV